MVVTKLECEVSEFRDMIANFEEMLQRRLSGLLVEHLVRGPKRLGLPLEKRSSE